MDTTVKPTTQDKFFGFRAVLLSEFGKTTCLWLSTFYLVTDGICGSNFVGPETHKITTPNWSVDVKFSGKSLKMTPSRNRKPVTLASPHD